MLILRASENEAITLFDTQGEKLGQVLITECSGGRVRLGFIGFDGMKIMRNALLAKIKREARQARQEVLA